MDRREAITTAGALAFAALSSAALGQEHKHDHHAHGNSYQSLVDASADCVVKGEACLNHCLDLLGQGDKEMAACAKTVRQTLALCGALESLSSQQSKYVPATAKLAMEACQACETECRKHEKKHAVCKACADACANCITQCKAFAA